MKLRICYSHLPVKTPIQRHIEAIRVARDIMHPTIGMVQAISLAGFAVDGEI